MTWAQVFKRLWYVLRVRFTKQHICKVCGEAEANRLGSFLGVDGVWECLACEEEKESKIDETEAQRQFNKEAYPERQYMEPVLKVNVVTQEEQMLITQRNMQAQQLENARAWQQLDAGVFYTSSNEQVAHVVIENCRFDQEFDQTMEKFRRYKTRFG